ncbi:MAG: hypothetical protein ALAOOOJD_01974 [bacterium]|nr:hypothetical protein [bacterium]
MKTPIEKKAVEIFGKLKSDPQLSRFVDSSLQIPKTYPAAEEIRSIKQIHLIILGQDPTVKNQRSRTKITTVLNLDRKGSLRNYLNGICKDLEIDLDKNVYATNCLKNFFIKPPAQIKEDNVFEDFAQVWLPLLQEELAQFDSVPIITLGEPILSIMVRGDADASRLVWDYWGFNEDWDIGKTLPFKYIKPDDNALNRFIFPFPHQPSISKKFYSARLKEYEAFVKQTISSQLRPISAAVDG